jgi:hypothetical protein
LVSPVTGPFHTFVTQGSTPVHAGGHYVATDKVGFRQRKPYNLPEPWAYSIKRIKGVSATGGDFTATLEDCWMIKVEGWETYLPPLSKDAYNVAFKRFVSRLKSAQAELGAVAAERQKSLDMIGKRSLQLYNFTRAIYRFRFADAAKALGVLQPKRLAEKRKAGKTAADLFLEFQFGWRPLIGDVTNAVKVLTEGLPAFRIKARARLNKVYSQNLRVSVGPGFDPRFHSFQDKNCAYDVGWALNARIRGTNPNTVLANELGLLNPAFAAWEVIPFSFVVDYFVNVGEWLNSFTDFAGFQLADVSRSEMQRATCTESNHWSWENPPGYPGGSCTWTSDRVELHRSTGSLPGPSLSIRPPWTLSPARAATSVALLVQALHRV